jgi:hypothetical protein
MNHHSTKASLSPNRRRLIETMQQLNFGRIEELHLCDGEPVFCPAPQLIQKIRFRAENGPRPESGRSDFVLRSSVVEMFDHLGRIGDGVVASIEVRHGLPFRLTVERVAQ